jgi:phosphatidylglycerol---prolipoprotein diacylglyceryl transferase
MKPEIHLLGLSIKTFGVMFALGFILSGLVLARRLRELELPIDWSYEMIFVALIGGLLGARVYFLIENYGWLGHHLLSNLLSASDLVWYGGAIGGALAVAAWMRRREALELQMLDVCATVLALGYAIGRIGCQLSGDGDYGIRSSLPWAMGYPHGTLPTPPGVRVQPTPIYETVVMALLAYVLWRMRDRVRPGVILACYLLGAGLERFLVEFVRRNQEILAGLTGPQLESIVLMAAGLGGLVLLMRRGGLAALGPTTA